MKHKGTKELQTNRLILRAFKETDAEEMYENWANDERVAKYLTWQAHKNVDETKMICKMWEEESLKLNSYQWLIILKDTNVKIGSISLVSVCEKEKAAEVGYCIGYNWWGQGYVPEALKTVLEYLKEIGFVRIVAKYDIENPNSGKVLTKCGFEKEGILRKNIFNNQKELVDAVICSIIFEENL